MNKKELKEHIRLILQAGHWDPFQVLGMHILDGESKKAAVRAFLPEALEAWVLDLETKKCFSMEKIHDAGFFEAVIDRKKVFPYSLRIKSYEG
jgi:1,4-alpha-glucan branching enzyme